MDDLKQLIVEAEEIIEGFLITHPRSKFAIDTTLRERLESNYPFRDRIFVLDFSTSIDLPDETHEFFHDLVKKYGADLLEQSMKIYLSKHRRQIMKPSKNVRYSRK